MCDPQHHAVGIHAAQDSHQIEGAWEVELQSIISSSSTDSEGPHLFDSQSDSDEVQTQPQPLPKSRRQQAPAAGSGSTGSTCASSSGVRRSDAAVPSSRFNLSTVWVGNISIVRRDDQAAPQFSYEP